ncbi:MAG: ribosome maturation factor RimP [Geminicoccaceae bacterium]
MLEFEQVGPRPAFLFAMSDEAKGLDAIGRILEPSLDAMGYDLVRVQLGGRPVTLQVMVEHKDRSTMTVDSCAEVSTAISALLDVEDPITGSYQLEVSSPGLDRPLTRLGDFNRFAGFEARLETVDAIDGQRRFKGVIDGVADENVVLRLEDRVLRVAFDRVKKAKLVLTDALIEASKKWAETGRSP